MVSASTVSELAGKVCRKLAPEAPSFWLVGATVSGCASEFIAVGSPVSTVDVPLDTADTPSRSTFTVVAEAPRFTTVRYVMPPVLVEATVQRMPFPPTICAGATLSPSESPSIFCA